MRKIAAKALVGRLVRPERMTNGQTEFLPGRVGNGLIVRGSGREKRHLRVRARRSRQPIGLTRLPNVLMKPTSYRRFGQGVQSLQLHAAST